MKKGLSQILLVAAALGTTNAFTPATRSAAVAGVALERAAGFEVVAHGLVAQETTDAPELHRRRIHTPRHACDAVP